MQKGGAPSTAGGGTIRPVGKPPAMPVGDWGKALDLIALKIISRTIYRMKRGLDAEGNPFAGYSDAYRKALARGGESQKVDLWVTGAMAGSLHVKEKKLFPKGGGRVVVGPSSETPQTYYFASGARKWGGVGRRLKDGKRGKAGARFAKLGYDQIGYIHQTGEGRMPKREWLGLTQKERDQLTRELQKMGIVGFRLSGSRGTTKLFRTK